MKTKPHDEFVGNCKICKQPQFRGGSDPITWVYHESVGIVCASHPGVKEWYDNLIKQANDDLLRDIIADNHPDLSP